MVRTGSRVDHRPPALEGISAREAAKLRRSSPYQVLKKLGWDDALIYEFLSERAQAMIHEKAEALRRRNKRGPESRRKLSATMRTLALIRPRDKGTGRWTG